MFFHTKIYKLNRSVLILIILLQKSITEDHLQEMESLGYPGADCSKYSWASDVCCSEFKQLNIFYGTTYCIEQYKDKPL